MALNGLNFEQLNMLGQGNNCGMNLINFGCCGGSVINSIMQYAMECEAEKQATGRVSERTKMGMFNSITDILGSKAASSFFGNITDTINLLGSVASQAIAETQAQKAEARQLKQEQKQALEDFNNQAKEIAGQIDEQNTLMEDAQTELEKIQTDIIENKQEELNNILKEIQTKQQALAATTDPAEQQELLKDIQGLSGQIPAITEAIALAQERINGLTEQIETYAETIETLKGNSVDIQINTEEKIAQITQAQAQNVKENQQTAVKGEKDLATAAALETKAATEAAGTVVSFGLTGVSAVKDQAKVIEYTKAGETRLESSATNLSTLASAVQGLDKVKNGIETFNGVIQNSLAKYDGCIGSIDGVLETLVTSIGSIANTANITGELNTAVENDLQNIGNAGVKENQNENQQPATGLQTTNIKIEMLEV